MNDLAYKSEIRESIVRELLEKARKQNYRTYLKSVRLEKIRLFQGAQINFDFPVTALIGPNGGGKTTLLGASACIYPSIVPNSIFKKSRVGDETMDHWRIEYELIDKDTNPKGTVRARVDFEENQWLRSNLFRRNVKLFSITRTIPAVESPWFSLKKKLSTSYTKEDISIMTRKIEGIDHIKREAERILGKSLAAFQLFEISSMTVRKKRSKRMVTESREILEDGRILIIRKPLEAVLKTRTLTTKQLLYIGSDGEISYSEFNFGSGESSVIRMVADIESLLDNSLVLIEEIENGLHPLAVRRMVEYLIDVALRKNIQAIFTTHSDYALAPLPSEAIWAVVDGRLQQGKLSVEVLRAVSGRVDKRLAIFVEDDFTKAWIEAVLREKLSENLEEIGIYPVYGDGNAVKTHCGHMSNPAIRFNSMCLIDGDSGQVEETERGVFRLPGTVPESTVFNSVLNNLANNIALLTVACQRPLDKQEFVANTIIKVSQTNRDPHLLFSQIGLNLGFIPEATVRGAFLAVWIQENPDQVNKIAESVKKALESPPK